ncbi:MAG: DegT/DnrJ/EryC1/StrS family aminotransferase [Burkholderiales bacterium]|nr:DegT/DnrJ/EryC1/StrS family aminotransferase [Burkholderiales bacterium]
MTGAVDIPLFRTFTSDDVGPRISAVLASGQLAMGPRVQAFEESLAQWLGVREVAAVSDGSAAITLALHLAGVQAGDGVLASPVACTASLMPIANIRAIPVWLDIDPDTGMTTPAEVIRAGTDHARAFLHVQWSGDPGDVQALAHAAREAGLASIVDATESFGAERDGRRWLDDADFTAWSFYASKTLSTGEGGALAARDPESLLRARQLRRFGIDRNRQRTSAGDLSEALDIAEAGWAMSLTDISASLGEANLPHMDRLLKRQRENAAFFDQQLTGIPGLKLLRRNLRSRPAFWTYSLRAERREDLTRKLHAAGIGAQRLHLRADRFSCFGGTPAELPGVALFDSENLSIPCGWWVEDADRERIVATIRNGW